MPIFQVTYTQRLTQTATVEVEARNKAEAEELGLEVADEQNAWENEDILGYQVDEIKLVRR